MLDMPRADSGVQTAELRAHILLDVHCRMAGY